MASPHRLAARVAGIAVVAAALVSAGTTHPSAAATKTPGLTPMAADWSWSQGVSPRVLHTSPDRTHIAAVPAVGSVPAGNGWPAVLFYSWVSNEDTGSAGPDTMVMRSTDGGATFGAPRAAESSFYALTRLPDGHLLDVAFIPRSIAADRRTVSMRVTESPDNGSTWVAKTSTFVLPYRIPAFDRGLRVNPDIVTDAHGWLYLSYYTAFEGDSGQRAEIAVSKDGGATWQRRGPIITASSTQQYNEVGLSRTPNGQMMAVISQGQTDNPGYRHHLKLVTARSGDDGATWGGYRVLPIARDRLRLPARPRRRRPVRHPPRPRAAAERCDGPALRAAGQLVRPVDRRRTDVPAGPPHLRQHPLRQRPRHTVPVPRLVRERDHRDHRTRHRGDQRRQLRGRLRVPRPRAPVDRGEPLLGLDPHRDDPTARKLTGPAGRPYVEASGERSTARAEAPVRNVGAAAHPPAGPGRDLQEARAAMAAYLRSGRSGSRRCRRSTSVKPAAARRREKVSAGQR